MSYLNFGRPVNNPVVPFSYEVPSPLPDCGMFIIDGFVPMDSQGFSVNVQTGPRVNPRDDVALHLGFRFPASVASLFINTIQNNRWDNPVEYPSCPLRKMDVFKIYILVQRRAFMIAFNDQHFCEFSHRIDPVAIRAIAVDGGVAVNLLQLEFPGGAPQNTASPQMPRPVSPVPPPATYASQPQVQFPAFPSSTPTWNAPQSSASYNFPNTPQQQQQQQQQQAAQQTQGSSSMKNLLNPATLGALGSAAAMAIPLFYPGKKKKMKHKGYKQRGMFGSGGLPFLGGSGGTGMGTASGAGLGAVLGTVGSMLASKGRGGTGYGHGGMGHGHGGMGFGHGMGHGSGGLLPGLGLGTAAGLGGAGLGYAMGHHGHGHHGHGWRRDSSSSSYSSDSD